MTDSPIKGERILSIPLCRSPVRRPTLQFFSRLDAFALPPTLDLGLSPKLYDYVTDDDRSLFLSCKRASSPLDQRTLDQEAHGNPLLADVLLFRRTLGLDRQHKYGTLITHLIEGSRSY